MPRQDGRIEQGQSLKTAISARAWNRAQDAADIVLDSRHGAQGSPHVVAQLPSVRVKLRDTGWYGQCRFAFGQPSQGQAGMEPLMPLSNTTLGEETDNAKSLVRFVLPQTRISGTEAGVLQSVSPVGDYGSGLFVCVGNDSNEYAMSGFAITRVRVFNFLHRYARNPVAFPGQTNAQASAVSGCLDSAFWGPARIVGYCATGSPSGIQVYHSLAPHLSFPTFVFRWALIQF